MKRYTREEREEVLSALRESATRAGGGVPVWDAVATQTGVGRQTLKRWWAASGSAPGRGLRQGKKTGDLVRLAPPKRETPSAGEELDDPLASPSSVFCAWLFSVTLQDIGDAKEAMSFGAVNVARDRLWKLYDAYQTARAEEGKHRQISEEETIRQLRAAAGEMPPSHLAVMMQVGRKRGLG